jgi:hypothetical protein
MKSAIMTLLIVNLFFLQSYGQVRNASERLTMQANSMGTAFIDGHYKTFADYTYPLILKSIGGTSKMIEVLNKTTIDMKSKGMTVGSITFDLPSKILRSDKELQSTIAQHTEIRLAHERIVSTSTLIAISNDNGLNWTFIDTSNKDMAILRKLLPNLSPSITIPPQPSPVRFAN